MRITESQLRRIVRQTISEMAGPNDSVGAPGSPSGADEAKVLQVLGDALESDIMPEDVAYITFQPRRSGGSVIKIDLEYKTPDTGISYSWLSNEHVRKIGMTLDQVATALRSMGAKSPARRPPVKRSMPYYD